MELKDLITDDLCIGLFHEDDAAAFTQAVRASVDSLSPWMPWCHADFNESEARRLITLFTKEAREDLAYTLGVYSLDRTLLIGGIAINQINGTHNFGNVAYWVRSSKQGNGIATRALRMITCFGFRVLGLNRLEIVAAIGNEASCKVAANAGATMEGIARKRLVSREQVHDAAIYSLVSR